MVCTRHVLSNVDIRGGGAHAEHWRIKREFRCRGVRREVGCRIYYDSGYVHRSLEVELHEVSWVDEEYRDTHFARFERCLIALCEYQRVFDDNAVKTGLTI